MKNFILGTKVGMTQIFDEEGKCTPVTVVLAGPCTVVQKKTAESDSYSAVKLAYREVDKKKLNKPDRGLFEKLEMSGFKYLREFKPENTDSFEIGQTITVSDMFKDGDSVDVSGTSKGKGYQGAIKRHGQKIGPDDARLKISQRSRLHGRQYGSRKCFQWKENAGPHGFQKSYGAESHGSQGRRRKESSSY